MRRAEVHKVLEAGSDERMPWAERGDRNRVGASIPALGLVKLVRALAYEGEVVERAREVRVEGPEAQFLYGGGLT